MPSPSVVHLVNVCLGALVAHKLLHKQKDDDWLALIAAAIFAVHPVQLEAVAWISGMTDSLMAVPFLLGFWSYLHFRRAQQTKWLALCTILFALAY